MTGMCGEGRKNIDNKEKKGSRKAVLWGEIGGDKKGSPVLNKGERTNIETKGV